MTIPKDLIRIGGKYVGNYQIKTVKVIPEPPSQSGQKKVIRVSLLEKGGE